MSAAEIYSKIKAANTVTPAGTITDGTKEFILKVDGELKRAWSNSGYRYFKSK